MGMVRTIGAATAVLALMGCELMKEPASLKPVARPKPPAAVPVVAKPTSKKSAELRNYFRQVQSEQQSQGLLRKDGGGTDTPFTAAMLARNFEQIAFFNEYNSSFTGIGGASPLRRWEGPIRFGLIFGDGVPPSQRKSDTLAVKNYAKRLAQLSGRPITVGGQPNFIVVIASEDDRTASLKQAATRLRGISAQSLGTLDNIRRDTYCVVASFAAGETKHVYTAALAVIRSENPDLLRLSCIHEELAQGLGLANDSPAARPSIFNDDDEFALLTRQDELLIKMLYDPRLRPGMSAEQARPTVKKIAAELLGGPV